MQPEQEDVGRSEVGPTMTKQSEMQAQAASAEPQDDAPPADLDPESLAAIRDLMKDAEPAAPAPRQAEAPKPAIAPAPAMAVGSTEETSHPQVAPASAAFPEIAPQAPQPEMAQERVAPAHSGRLSMRQRLQIRIDDTKARITGYRPTVKHIAIAAMVLLVLLRPWLIVGVIFLTLFIFTSVFLILGYDGFWKRAMAIGRWYARRNPERSVELHHKLDTFAVRWDAILDRFPEGTVDGLYLPDFGELAHADARHEAAMERRLDSLRESEASA